MEVGNHHLEIHVIDMGRGRESCITGYLGEDVSCFQDILGNLLGDFRYP